VAIRTSTPSFARAQSFRKIKELCITNSFGEKTKEGIQ